MKKQTIALILTLFFGLTSAYAAPTCQSVLEPDILKSIRKVEQELQKDDLNPEALIKMISGLPIQERLDTRMYWLVAQAHYKKSDLPGYRKSYRELQRILNVTAVQQDISLLPGSTFIEAYLHLRKKLGLNTFDGENSTDLNFMALTRVSYIENAPFDSRNWGPYQTYGQEINVN